MFPCFLKPLGGPQFCFFTKRSTLLLEKSRKNNFLRGKTCKILTFFVNASRLGEMLKKGTYLEKKAGILSFRMKSKILPRLP